MKYINPIDQDVPALVSDITSTIRSQELVTRYHDSIIGIEQAKQSYIHQMATQIDEINSEKLQFLGESLPASRQYEVTSQFANRGFTLHTGNIN